MQSSALLQQLASSVKKQVAKIKQIQAASPKASNQVDNL